MSNENAGPLDITMPTSTTKTAVPMIVDGHLATFKFNGVSVKKTDKGPMLTFEWDLVNPAPSTEGVPIEPGKMGSKFFENIALFDKNTPAGTWPKWAIDRVSNRIDGMLGTGDPDNKKNKPVRPDFGPDLIPTLIGKQIVVKMKVKTGDFVGNEFGTITFPGDIAA